MVKLDGKRFIWNIDLATERWYTLKRKWKSIRGITTLLQEEKMNKAAFITVLGITFLPMTIGCSDPITSAFSTINQEEDIRRGYNKIDSTMNLSDINSVLPKAEQKLMVSEGDLNCVRWVYSNGNSVTVVFGSSGTAINKAMNLNGSKSDQMLI
jgi:hypothetical protein